MLLFTAFAQAGVWNVCAATESNASVNAGWTIIEARDSAGERDADKGSLEAVSTVVKRFEPRREEDFCKATDGVGGATQRWTTELIAVDIVPGQKSCPTAIWADAYGDTGGHATITAERLSASAVGHAVTTAQGGNTGTISVDGGGGASFLSEWSWQVPGPSAAVAGVVKVDAASAYNGAILNVPGWAQVNSYGGVVDAWVRRGAEWVHVQGTSPMEIPFGATVSSRGGVCASGRVTAGSQARTGESSAGGSGIHFSMEPVHATDPVDRRPVKGPTFDPCGC